MIATLTPFGASPVPPPDTLVTGEELLRHPEWGPCELVRGKVVPVCRPNKLHGRLAARLTAALDTFAEQHHLGMVFTDSGVFTERGPDTVRGPDLYFVRAENCPKEDAWGGYFEVPPDLCVEIASPNDKPNELYDKIEEYLRAGVKLVWVIDPEARRARIYRADHSWALVPADGVLSGESVLPGFEFPLSELFAALELK